MQQRAIRMLVLYAGIIALIAWAFLSTPQESHFVRESPPLGPVARASILFGGDMMFDRTIRTLLEREGEDHVFSCISDVLQESDLVVANLEGSITSQPSKSVGTAPGIEGNYTFTFPTSTAALLARHNIGLVNLGNNHILNFGYEGLAETREWLSRHQVRHFGAPGASQESRIARLSLRGVPFSFVNWNDWGTVSREEAMADVQREVREGRITIVYAHWGEEYAPVVLRVRDLAHAFADAGVDLVIGSHPHIVQESEVYNGVPIYYSLGNFIFDQYWDESVRRGLLVRADFLSGGLMSVEEIPVASGIDRRPCAG